MVKIIVLITLTKEKCKNSVEKKNQKSKITPYKKKVKYKTKYHNMKKAKKKKRKTKVEQDK